MHGIMNIVVAVGICCLATIVVGAPVSKSNFDDIKAALKSQLKDQEQALESLTSLQGEGTNGIQISKTKSMSYSNINGAENKYETQEEKVSEPETEKLISDIKSELQQQQESPEAEVKSSYQASVDVPAENIHETISNDGNEAPLIEETEPQSMDTMKDLEFTPRVVAEYLYSTGETQEFQSLLNELVDTSEISSEDAEQYEKAVMDELYEIEQEQNMVNVPQLDTLYQQGFADNSRSMFPMYDNVQGPSDVYPLYGFGQNQQKASQDNMADYVNYVMNKPLTLDEMINSIMDKWLTNAIVNGDQEAEDILSNIVDYVSRDNDPNDEAQVKAILGDIFAEALLEDLTPRIEPQQVDVGQSQLPVDLVDEANEQQEIPEVAPAEQSIPDIASQKTKRAKELQEPAPVTGEEQAVKM
ncbi:hypothetical protein ACF0H5_024479 [Mactra antiquata]